MHFGAFEPVTFFLNITTWRSSPILFFYYFRFCLHYIFFNLFSLSVELLISPFMILIFILSELWYLCMQSRDLYQWSVSVVIISVGLDQAVSSAHFPTKCPALQIRSLDTLLGGSVAGNTKHHERDKVYLLILKSPNCQPQR